MIKLLKLFFTLLLMGACGTAACAEDRRVEQVHFAKGASSVTIKGTIKGYQYVDYQLRAGAGQTMYVQMKASKGANYFNVLPPGSRDAAMFNSQFGGGFKGLLPDDGVYTVRVYLMRSAARRNETSNYALSLKISGKALRPLSAAEDAKLPNTRFHASAPGKCVPYMKTQLQACDYFVTRRGHDGTATVEVRPDENSKICILFIQGKPVSSDTSRKMRFEKKGDLTIVSFDDYGERYEIADALLTGG